MTARSMPCDTWPAGASMGGVSVHPAACGRRRGRASPALQNLPLHCTRQKTRPITTRPRTIAELTAPTFLQTEGRLRTRKPFIHAVVAVPSVVAVQKAPPRSQRPPEVLQNLPGGWFLGHGVPPGALGSSGAFSNEGNAHRFKNLAAIFGNRLIRFINQAVKVHFSQ